MECGVKTALGRPDEHGDWYCEACWLELAELAEAELAEAQQLKGTDNQLSADLAVVEVAGALPDEVVLPDPAAGGIVECQDCGDDKLPADGWVDDDSGMWFCGECWGELDGV